MKEIVHSYKLNCADSQYPLSLKSIYDPPKALYCKGNLVDCPLVAVVGTRRPTAYGAQVTESIVSDLAAAGIGIVSGLALGIDSIAHRAALDAGGYTIAVLGNGIDDVYPASNRWLANRILDSGGAIISELPSKTPPLKHHFPARNRIIAGLSFAVLVTEADWKSGTLYTANFALENGRDVMAIPGSILSEASAGPNNLIRQGAQLVTDASHIVDALGIEYNRASINTPLASNNIEKLIIETLLRGPCNSQQLIESGQLDASSFAHTITLMEISGKVKNLGRGRWGLSRKLTP